MQHRRYEWVGEQVAQHPCAKHTPAGLRTGTRAPSTREGSAEEQTRFAAHLVARRALAAEHHELFGVRRASRGQWEKGSEEELRHCDIDLEKPR